MIKFHLEPLVELETDKVNVEVPSPSNGVLENISAKEGETVNVGALLGSISQSKLAETSFKDDPDEKKYSPPKLEKKENKKNSEKSKQIKKKASQETMTLNTQPEHKIFDEEPLVLEEEPLILETAHNEKLENENNETTENSLRISPAARKIASEKKIDVQSIKGSGKNGLVLKEDVMSLMGVKPAPSERKIAHA